MTDNTHKRELKRAKALASHFTGYSLSLVWPGVFTEQKSDESLGDESSCIRTGKCAYIYPRSPPKDSLRLLQRIQFLYWAMSKHQLRPLVLINETVGAEPACGLHTHFWKHIFLDVPVIWLSGPVQCALDEMGESFTVSLTWPKIWSKSIKHIMLFQIFSCGNKIRTWLMITRKKFLMTFVFQEWRGKSATRTYIRFTDIDFNLEQKNPNEWAKC